MRLFIAIFPPKEYLDYFRDVLREFDKEKRNLLSVELENIHFTARFIGSKVSEASKQIIAKELMRSAGSYTKPVIELGELSLGFPRQHHPKVIFSEIQRDDDLDRLVDQLHKKVREQKRKDTILWQAKSARHYHFSIARLKPAAVNKSTISRFKDILSQVDLPKPEPFYPEEMYLVRSEITPKGPKYKKMEKIKL